MKMFVLFVLAAASVAHAQTQLQLAKGYRAESFQTRNLSAFASDVETHLAGLGAHPRPVAPAHGPDAGNNCVGRAHGEEFSRAWVQSVGHEANVIFVPC